MFVLIKPSSQSVYNNVVAVMDELNIVDNQFRAIVAISPMDIELLKRDPCTNNLKKNVNILKLKKWQEN